MLLALALCGALAGCGGSSPTTPRNEAAWAEAKQKAHAEVELDEGLLGAKKSRENEQELAKAEYNTIIAGERVTPKETEEVPECGENETAPIDGCKE